MRTFCRFLAVLCCLVAMVAVYLALVPPPAPPAEEPDFEVEMMRDPGVRREVARYRAESSENTTTDETTPDPMR